MSEKVGRRTVIKGGIACRDSGETVVGGGEHTSESVLESMSIGGDGGQGSWGGSVRRPLLGSTMATGKADLGTGATTPAVEQASLVDVSIVTTLWRGDGRVGV